MRRYLIILIVVLIGVASIPLIFQNSNRNPIGQGGEQIAIDEDVPVGLSSQQFREAREPIFSPGSCKIIDSFSGEGIDGAILNFLNLETGERSTIISNQDGMVSFPKQKGENLASLNAPGYCGRILTGTELATNNSFKLAPNGSLKIELASEDKQLLHDFKIILIPPLKGAIPWRQFKSKLDNVGPGDRRALGSLKEVALFFGEFENHTEKQVEEFLKSKVWVGLPSMLPWNSMIPDYLNFPLRPQSYVRELGGAEELYWTSLPAGSGYRWMHASKYLVEMAPPFELPRRQRTPTGTVSRSEVPVNLSGEFAIEPGKMQVLKAKISGDAIVMGQVDYGEHVPISEPRVMLIGYRDRFRDGELIGSDKLTEQSLFIKEENGQFEIRGVAPGKKKLFVYWPSNANKLVMLAVEFQIGELESKDLGLLRPVLNNPLKVKVVFAGENNNLLSSDELLLEKPAAAQLLISSKSRLNERSSDPEGFIAFNPLDELELIGLEAKEYKLDLYLPNLLAKYPFVIQTKMSHSALIDLSRDSTLEYELKVLRTHPVVFSGPSIPGKSSGSISLSLIDLENGATGTKLGDATIGPNGWSYEASLDSGNYVALAQLLMPNGEKSFAGGSVFQVFENEKPSVINIELHPANSVTIESDSQESALEVIAVYFHPPGGHFTEINGFNMVKRFDEEAQATFHGIPQGWVVKDPRKRWSPFIAESKLQKISIE